MSQKRDAMELFIDLLLLCISLSTRHIVLAQYDQYACPPGWEEFTGYCYQFVKDPRLNRANYMKECTTNGAYGTSVLSAEEHNFISQQLEIYDSSQIKQSWWTSGKRITDSSLEFFWEGDGSKVEAYYYWLDETELSDLTRNYIIYSFDGYKWGWSIANQTVTYPYICKILKEDIYKIQEKARGPDYGVANTDSETIERGPSFIEEPSDVIYDEASVTKYTQINCEADAYPPPSYEWYKWRSNVEEVIDSTTDTRYTMVNGKLIIHIPSVENKDDAEYHCRPYNKFGKIRSQSANLGFGYLLDFPKSPRSPVTATAYQWIQIECSPPRHYPDILYTWYKNDIYNFINTDLKPYIFISHDSRLYFSEVTSDDEGYYYCLVYTPGQDISQGKVSMPTELRVVYGSPGAYEPVIGSDFPSIYPRSPLVGDNIRIECWAYGTSIPDPLSYYWVKLDANDNEVSLPTQSYVTDNNRVLIIPNVHVYDAGKYRCHCQRINGQMTAKTVELTLKARPYFTLELEDQYVDEATELRWRCEAGGDPSPSYFWLKNGIILNNSTIPSSDQGRVIVSNNMLIIKNLEASKDDGMYQCGANNSYATRYSSAQLKVLGFAPTFEKYPMQPNQYATIAGNTTLMCQPEAAPYPTIDGFKWYKNGVQLNPGTSAGSRLLLLPNGNLFINSVQQTDQGLYKCEASNNYGKASTQGNLTVLQTTTISLAPQDRTVEVNKTTFLHCMASHNPLLDVTYTWYHGTRMIEFQKYFWIGETQYITWYNPYYKRGSGLYYGGLYIMYAQHEHKGDYTCWVESTIDRFSQSAKIEIVGPPSEPVGVFVDLSSITATSVKIQWKAGGSNGKDIISYVIEGINTYEGFWKILHTNVPHEPSDDDTLYYTVTNLHPNSNYRLRVRAENELGTSEPSPESDEFLTLPITPTKYPEQVGGGGGKIGTLTITWKRLELWEQNGPGIGYIVKWKEAGDSDWDGEEKVGDVGYYVETNDIGQDNYYNEYDVLVQAFNDAGLGPVSPVVRIRSAMGLPTGIPTNILVEPFNATCCIVHWNPVEDSKDYMKGKLGGYRVSYWRSGIEDRETSFRVTVNGQITEAYIIGLYPNTQYEFDVMVWNEAGNGPRSQSFKQKTLRDAPLYPPVEVKVFRRSSTSIWLTWRGVTTTSQEEPLWGYKVRIWRAGEDIRNATNYDAARNTELSITGLRDDVTYKLRVLGYSRGGDGTMSFPTKVFTLASSSNVKSSLFCILFAFLITLLLFCI